MSTEDKREDLINDLCMYIMGRKEETVQDIKSALYMIAAKYEIISRSTEIVEVNENRNEELLKRFLVAKNVSGCTKRTLSFYAVTVKKVLCDIGKTADDITADDIRYYMAVRLRRDKVSKVTVGNEIRGVSSFFTWLQDQEVIKKNPMRKVERIRCPKVKKKAFTELEVEQLRGACRNERESFAIEFLLSTGCRVTEAVQVLLQDIDGEQILVRGKGEKDRYVYMNARTQYAFEKYMKQRTDNNPYLFPKGKEAKYISKKLKPKEAHNWWIYPELVNEGHMETSCMEALTRKIAKRSGVERANPHKFRRTCATMALRRGMPIEQVSKMLGHEQLDTTKIYLDLTEEDLRIAHQRFVV